MKFVAMFKLKSDKGNLDYFLGLFYVPFFIHVNRLNVLVRAQRKTSPGTINLLNDPLISMMIVAIREALSATRQPRQ